MFNIPGESYRGVVHEWGQFKNAALKTLWGYHVHYAAGDKYWHIEAEVYDYVIDDSDDDSVSVQDWMSKSVDRGDQNDREGYKGEHDDGISVNTDTRVDVESDLYFRNGVSPDWCVIDNE